MGFLDYDGLLHFWQQIKTKFAAASHTHAIADTTGLQEALNGKASFLDIDDMATFLTRSDMDANLADLGIATPLNYANAQTLMANAGMFSQDGSTCTNVNAMAEIISALCQQIDANTSNISGKADSATTLSGYGITDAYTKTETYTKEEVDAAIAAAIAGINTDTFHWDAGERTAATIVLGQGLSINKYYTNFNANTGGLANGTGGSSVDSSGNVTVNNSTYYGGVMVPFEVEPGKTYRLTCDIPYGLLSWGGLNSLSTTSSSLDSPQTKPTHLVNNWSDSGGTQSFEITPTTPYIYIAFGNSDKKPVTWSSIKFVERG